MLKERSVMKKIVVMLLIVAMILPFASEVLAATTLKQTDTTASFETSIEHEGGDEETGMLSSTSYTSNYDYHQYRYQIANSGSSGRTTVFKIIQEGDTEFLDALYCLNAEKSFPSDSAQEYSNIGDVLDTTSTAATSLINSIGSSNYNSLVWILNNMYLRKQDSATDKLAFIEAAFADTIAANATSIPPLTAEYIASIITDDDIEVVQQWAIWYFTNGNSDGMSSDYASSYYNAKYSTFGTVYVAGYSTNGEYLTLTEADTSNGAARQEFMNILYSYLVNTAKTASASTTVTYPSFAMENSDMSAVVDGDYYKVGPFNITSGTASSSEYSIALVDQNGDVIDSSAYEILIDGESSFTSLAVDEIFDKDFYIYLPIDGNTISTVRIVIGYTVSGTQASLWTASDSTYQPVVLITRDTTPYADSREYDVPSVKFDLALRKYIIKVGNTSYTNRTPEVDTSTIATEGTATYKHAKGAITVSAGDTVVYEIRVYNEGDLDGTATKITDYLPEGMTLTENSTINDTYGWYVEDTEGRIVSTEYLKDSTIEAYDGGSTLDSLYVQIECTIAENIADSITSNLTLTNVAEITGYSKTDSDSSPSINQSDINTSTFSGNKDNKTDLTDSDYYYEGLEDDDDFEKVVVEPLEETPEIDLALKKFITEINGTEPTTSREPEVDVTPLKNGEEDADYETVKTALEVEQGDIVTYTIRVYNEGDVDAYAEQIADYLPTGLGYLVNYTDNISNKWTIPSDATTTTLSEITNGTTNLSEDDFTSDLDLEDEIVVTGGGKFTSSKLASSSTSTSNLIAAFDSSTGKLSYKDITITCIVLTDEVDGNNLRNIAEIVDDSDEERAEIEDRDSIPDTVDPDNYPDGEKTSNNGEPQDDHDYENLSTPSTEVEVFDLALQKFITALNDTAVTDRYPTITKNSDGSFRYSHTSDPLSVANSDLITYTIRVYNEGNVDGYAAEITDDIPDGLVYLPDNTTNKTYGWEMLDKNGDVTTDVNQAVSVRTTYLSKENGTETNGVNSNVIAAYDEDTMSTPAYKDVQIVFQVSESALSDTTTRTITNTAEITEDQDADGNDVTDQDSTPGNNKSGEDDIDSEKVYVKYFDLSLKKSLAKIVITENGTTREVYPSSEDDLLKVEINRKYISTTVVKFVYNITVTNEGEISGYATEIRDYIPDGLVFNSSDNSNWEVVSDNVVKTTALASTLLDPGASATVQITLQWSNSETNMGQKTNVAEISADANDKGASDIDSTPNNQASGEDDIDDAPVILAISTGEGVVYIGLTTAVLAILATGIVLIKKYVLI